MRVQHWQDVASLLLGAWLVLSPLALGFVGAAAWMTVVLGIGVILFAIEGAHYSVLSGRVGGNRPRLGFGCGTVGHQLRVGNRNV